MGDAGPQVFQIVVVSRQAFEQLRETARQVADLVTGATGGAERTDPAIGVDRGLRFIAQAADALRQAAGEQQHDRGDDDEYREGRRNQLLEGARGEALNRIGGLFDHHRRHHAVAGEHRVRCRDDDRAIVLRGAPAGAGDAGQRALDFQAGGNRILRQAVVKVLGRTLENDLVERAQHGLFQTLPRRRWHARYRRRAERRAAQAAGQCQQPVFAVDYPDPAVGAIKRCHDRLYLLATPLGLGTFFGGDQRWRPGQLLLERCRVGRRGGRRCQDRCFGRRCRCFRARRRRGRGASAVACRRRRVARWFRQRRRVWRRRAQAPHRRAVVERGGDRARRCQQVLLLLFAQQDFHFAHIAHADQRNRCQRRRYQQQLGAQANPRAHH